MKRTMIACVLLFAAFTMAFQPAALAYGGGKGSYSKGKMDLEGKFYGKVDFLMHNEEELGLTEEQVGKIKALKDETEKALIMKQAEIDIVAVEMKSGLWQDTIDTAALSKLAEKKYGLKKDKAVKLIESYGALKQILTKDQRDNMKKLWKEQAKSGMCSSMGMGKGMAKGDMTKRGGK